MVGNGYEAPEAATRLPNNWAAAIDAFAASTEMNLYLGERFVQHFSTVKRVEMANFMAEVTSADYDWYLRSA